MLHNYMLYTYENITEIVLFIVHIPICIYSYIKTLKFNIFHKI